MIERETIHDSVVSVETTTLFVRGLIVSAEIGVHEHERRRRQTLLIDVHLVIGPVQGMTLADTLDYAVIVSEAESIATSGHILLVETFADRLGRALLSYASVMRVVVSVAKPSALEPAAATAGVELVMLRSDRS